MAILFKRLSNNHSPKPTRQTLIFFLINLDSTLRIAVLIAAPMVVILFLSLLFFLFFRVCVCVLLKEEEEETNYPEGYGRNVVVVVCTVSCVVCLRILLNVLSSQCSLPTPLPHRPENTKRSLKRSPPGTPLPFLFLFFSEGGYAGCGSVGEREEGRRLVRREIRGSRWY